MQVSAVGQSGGGGMSTDNRIGIIYLFFPIPSSVDSRPAPPRLPAWTAAARLTCQVAVNKWIIIVV